MDLIEIRALKTHFFLGKGILSRLFGRGLRVVHALDGVDLTVRKGKTFGLVGESGCGKSTLGLTLFRLIKALSGEVLFQGRDVLRMNQHELAAFRRRVHMIFQDQFGCLNPRMTAGQIIAEPIRIHEEALSTAHLSKRVGRLLDAVHLSPDSAVKFPHEFSGGQARRIGVARAIALNPEFIVADEPTSGLDISTAATILNLMRDLQEQLNLTYLWISHNLNQVQYMSDYMAVLYLGKVVETGPTEEIFRYMAHPYTKALISAVPKVGASGREKIVLEGEIPSPINPPSGCHFRTRCPHAMGRCLETEPRLVEIAPGHSAACHLLSES